MKTPHHPAADNSRVAAALPAWACRAAVIAALSLGLSVHFPGAGCSRRPRSGEGSPPAGEASGGTAAPGTAAPGTAVAAKPVLAEPAPTVPATALSEAEKAEIARQ